MSPNTSDQGKLTSAGKVLEVLLLFSATRTELSAAQISELIDATSSTTYRYLALLKKLHLLTEGRPNYYHPTARVIPLARAAQVTNPLTEIAKPLLHEAVDLIGETVMLLQKVGDLLICTELVESPHHVRYTIPRGRTIPLGVGASGKLGLAMADQETRDRLRPPHLPAEQLDEVLNLGYATSGSEIDMGSWACSVPVPIPGEVAVLSCAGPETRISPERRAATIGILRTTALQIANESSRFAL